MLVQITGANCTNYVVQNAPVEGKMHQQSGANCTSHAGASFTSNWCNLHQLCGAQCTIKLVQNAPAWLVQISPPTGAKFTSNWCKVPNFCTSFTAPNAPNFVPDSYQVYNLNTDSILDHEPRI
ncbi:hypothetical protein Fot_01678 [Forsythia ovata]|uniref:Uncharacterized protein n=1 Tax=Forsythia ovata TaxID=205694 RepID=A0ABD1X4W4_9LAMI